MSQPLNQPTIARPAVLPANNDRAQETPLPASFVGKSGRFYIRQRRADGSGFHHRLTVWPSVEDYNHRRSVLPTFCDVADALTDFSHAVRIYPESLTTTPSACEPDRDETDLGLTPPANHARDRWAKRFAKAHRPYAK